MARCWAGHDGRWAHRGGPAAPFHARLYFLCAGDVTAPIVYQVENIRDGKSFCTRNVKGIQHGQNIFLMSASFAVHEDGLEHQMPMPQVEGPEGIPSEFELRKMIAPNASAYRGMNFGRIFMQGGALVATVAQEGLIRLREVPETY